MTAGLVQQTTHDPADGRRGRAHADEPFYLFHSDLSGADALPAPGREAAALFFMPDLGPDLWSDDAAGRYRMPRAFFILKGCG